jgi:hypothetical protein
MKFDESTKKGMTMTASELLVQVRPLRLTGR